jgi:hypothetical protein
VFSCKKQEQIRGVAARGEEGRMQTAKHREERGIRREISEASHVTTFSGADWPRAQFAILATPAARKTRGGVIFFPGELIVASTWDVCPFLE